MASTTSDDQPPPKPGDGGGGEAEDLELAALPPARRRRSPLVAAAVIVLAGVVGWHLRADVKYAFASRTPTDLGDARSVGARNVVLGDNSHVTLRGLPDRRDALYLEPRGEKSRQTFYRLLGTNTRLFVRAEDAREVASPTDVWTGRLRRFDALPYAGALREYYDKEVEAARYLTPEALKQAVEHHGGSVVDRAGETLTVSAGEIVDVDTADPNRVEVLLWRDKFAAQADAEKEVERLGLVTHTSYGNQQAYGVLVDVPAERRNQVLGKLETAGLAFRPAETRWRAPLDQLKLDGDKLVFASAEVVRADGERVKPAALPASVPLEQLKAGSVDAPITIADDAWVLIEGEAPDAFWWAPAIEILLLLFAAFNVWYLLASRDPHIRHAATQKG